MKDLSGKKLLVISSDSNDLSFVEAAKEMGMYVVCCDRYTDWNISPAKKAADEGWNVDYTDTQTVAKMCRETGINGVIAGYSEDRVLAACRISDAIGTPFYATAEQIQLTRNKRAFKDLCKENGILVPQDYCFSLPLSDEDRNNIVYPVIVKPTDSGGRKGISVCFYESELDEAVSLATEQSKNGTVVIESYISGVELSAIYTLKDGEISLSCLNDKYTSEAEEGRSQLCDLVLTPSRHYEEYIKTTDKGIKELLRSMGAKNGVANFQLIANENGIYAFEMGYRVNGNDDFKVIRKNNGIDFLKMLISYSVTGDMGDDLAKDNPCFLRYNSTLSMYLHGGTIASVEYENVNKRDNIDDISILRQPGLTIIEDGTNRQKALMVKFNAGTIEEVADTIHYIQENISFTDTEGNNMLLTPFRTERLPK